MIRTIAGSVISKDGKFLLVQEKNPKVYGLWNFPAGHVDEGETPEAAAVREAFEETGFNVKIVRKLFTLDKSELDRILIAFEVELTGGELNFPEDEILDAQWFSLEEIKAMTTELRNPEFTLGALGALK
jgi:8-oxo-dGTP pyrophosphatase MutT (NUDIX family)